LAAINKASRIVLLPQPFGPTSTVSGVSYQGQLLGTYSVQGEVLSNPTKKKTKKKSRRAKKKAA